MAQATYEVHLAIYDLSRGMARNLSAQFLGPDFAIDAIPHTGIVVFGREYFFGGSNNGISMEQPSLFRQSTGMFPIETQSLGHTTVSQGEFEQWCQSVMQSGQYNAAAYDLMTRNCNNFSHDAAMTGLGLPAGVPAWVLDVPRRFLSSPMGQMVRPMLENMQLSNVPGAQPVTSAPFAAAAASTVVPAASQSPTPAANPWASIPAQNAPTKALKTDSTVQEPSAVLDTFTKPLLSNDTNTAAMCVKKLSASTDDVGVQSQLTSVLSSLILKNGVDGKLAQQVCHFLHQCLESGSNLMFSLMLLRLIVLQSPPGTDHGCLDWCVQHLTNSDNTDTTTAQQQPLSSPAARTMAWLTVSNVIASAVTSSAAAAQGQSPTIITAPAVLEKLVEAAVGDLSLDSQPRPEVRQAAGALLYNVVLFLSSDKNNMKKVDVVEEPISDTCVSMLCAVMEGVALEPDATAKLRRLMVVGRLLKDATDGHINAAAKSLVADLGFDEALVQVAFGKGQPTGDAEQCRKLAKELVQIVNTE